MKIILKAFHSAIKYAWMHLHTDKYHKENIVAKVKIYAKWVEIFVEPLFNF